MERSNEPFLKAVHDEDLLSPGMPKEISEVKRMEAHKEKVLRDKLTVDI